MRGGEGMQLYYQSCLAISSPIKRAKRVLSITFLVLFLCPGEEKR